MGVIQKPKFKIFHQIFISAILEYFCKISLLVID